ncbi:hypothetical protein [Citreimonas sp.]|uniref:hypothetical protein n=1 Tax=Citreimonas sp. TaxID=3036715 RepID=UPI0035C78DB1
MIRTIFAAATLVLMPALASAACYGGHEQAMSCADGMVLDTETNTCTVVSG